MAILSSKNVRFELKDPNQFKHGIFLIFRNNSNEFWDFNHGTNMGATWSQASLYISLKFIFGPQKIPRGGGGGGGGVRNKTNTSTMEKLPNFI